VVIVSDGTAVRGVASECGDEPLWLARKLPAAIVVVGAKRSEAAAAAIELGADLIVLDDGFSHHALKRTVDVLVVNGDGGLGNRRLLPAGPLREPASAAGRADLLWMSRVASGDVSSPPGLPRLPSVRSTYEGAGLVTLDLVRAESVESLQDKRILGVCGIARPESFRASLAQTGAIVRDVIAFPDHHSFTAEDVARVEKMARGERCEFIVTTEKDAMRLAEVTSSTLFRALAMETTVVGDAAALDALIRRFAHMDMAGAA
jgi:tetraacyldisaccharide 4'-kinase